jgi:hypothetical protein
LLTRTVIYLALNFVFAWLCWGLCALIIDDHLDLPLVDVAIFGSFGPFIAAGICAWLSGGAIGVLQFYGRVFNWRMGWLVFTVSFFLLPALCTISTRVITWQTDQPFAFQMSRWGRSIITYGFGV